MQKLSQSQKKRGQNGENDLSEPDSSAKTEKNILLYSYLSCQGLRGRISPVIIS